MSPTQDNFLFWWQLHMLITGQPDKMLRELRNTKGSTQLSAMSLWIVGCDDNHNVSKSFAFTLYVTVLGRYSKVTASLLQQLTLIAEATTT